MLHSIDKARRLYVLNHGTGYTCNGFDYLNKQATALRDWYFEQDSQAIPQIPARVGTKKHFEACQKVITQVSRYCNHKKIKCPAQLSPQLKGLEGRRVEVETLYGEIRRFNVGLSTGWLPIHLEVARANSTGGISAEQQYKSVRIVK